MGSLFGVAALAGWIVTVDGGGNGEKWFHAGFAILATVLAGRYLATWATARPGKDG